ncbi:uncharacterized protein LOC143877002 isoform X2 [Tasmannia lanceolata]|uniref:uncharacterized protein LOC143877002 isoform X2 n=1 Tax=Tasmannia lanceolata TaxID=3420 RepID=UPI004062D930
MKKRAAAKSTSNLLFSPTPVASPYLFGKSPRPYDSKKTLLSSPLLNPIRSPPQENLKTISDVKNLASSHANSIKRKLDLCHAEFLKEIDSSRSRLSKRFKSHACMQVSDQAEKEYKKTSDRISENTAAMKASFAEFITEAQATASCVCKVSIPEITRSMEKAIESLSNGYGILSAPI